MAVRLAIKAVPGAKSDEIVGPLGDRLKVRVCAPPEGGKANDAICALIAGALGVRRQDVAVVSGHGRAEKVVEVRGVEPGAVRALLDRSDRASGDAARGKKETPGNTSEIGGEAKGERRR
ncbi:MAG: DUF167 domain-containing protein [Phycisphaerales bacterium]